MAVAKVQIVDCRENRGVESTYRVLERCLNCGETWIAEHSFGYKVATYGTGPHCGVYGHVQSGTTAEAEAALRAAAAGCGPELPASGLPQRVQAVVNAARTVLIFSGAYMADLSDALRAMDAGGDA